MTRREEVRVPDIGDFSDVEIVEVQVKAGRHGCRRGAADHARDRQGGDGRAVAGRRPHRRAEGRQGRPGVEGQPDRDPGGGGSSGSRHGAGVTARPAGQRRASRAGAGASRRRVRRRRHAHRGAHARPVATLPPIDEATFGKAHASPVRAQVRPRARRQSDPGEGQRSRRAACSRPTSRPS